MKINSRFKTSTNRSAYFAGELKTTLFYILSGSVLLYVVNLLRIVILTIGLYYYADYEAVLHAVVFPGIYTVWYFYYGFFG